MCFPVKTQAVRYDFIHQVKFAQTTCFASRATENERFSSLSLSFGNSLRQEMRQKVYTHCNNLITHIYKQVVALPDHISKPLVTCDPASWCGRTFSRRDFQTCSACVSVRDWMSLLQMKGKPLLSASHCPFPSSLPFALASSVSSLLPSSPVLLPPLRAR